MAETAPPPSRIRSSAWWIALVLGGLAVGGLFLVPSGEGASAALITGVRFAAAVAVVAGILLNRPTRTIPWYLLAASLALLATATAVAFATNATTAAGVNSEPKEWVLLAALVTLLAGFGSLFWTKETARDPGGLLDALILAAGAAVLAWVLVEPFVVGNGVSGLARVLIAGRALVDLILLAVAARAFVLRGFPTPALRLLALALTARLAGDLAFGFGTRTPGNPVPDAVMAAWLMFAVLLAAAALHPTMRTITDPAPELLAHVWYRRSLLAAGALIPPAMVLLETLQHQTDVWVLVGVSAGIMILVLARISGLLVDVEDHRRTEGRLREAEGRLRTLIEGIPAVVYTQQIGELGVANETTYVSPQIEDLLGHSAAEFEADPRVWLTLVHPDDRDALVERAGRSISAREPFDMEYRVTDRDGNLICVHDAAVFVTDPTGPRLNRQGVILDITDRRRTLDLLQESERRFRRLAENAPDMIFRIHLEPLRFEYMNPAATALTGFEPEEYYADPEIGLRQIHPEDQPLIDALRGAPAEAVRGPLAFRWVRKDGSVIWVDARIVPLVDEAGNLYALEVIARDITERKRAEEELKRALGAEREAGDRLRALDEMKNAFLTAVSHELRTPLTAVLGSALTLERNGQVLSQEEREQLVRAISSNAEKLRQLLTDLLDIDRLRRGMVEPNLVPTDLPAFIRQVTDDAGVLGDRPVHVETEPIVIGVDRSKVERIVENLLTNAARHTPPGTPVWVRVAPSDGGALIAVEDAGPGIPDDLKEAVFEAFRQGPLSGSSPSPGVGVGLSLVAKFTELHGGRTWVQDRPGGGASFRVFLPGVGVRRPPRAERGLESWPERPVVVDGDEGVGAGSKGHERRGT